MTTRNRATTAAAELAALGSATTAALVVWLLLARPLDVVDAVTGHELSGLARLVFTTLQDLLDAPPRTAVTEPDERGRYAQGQHRHRRHAGPGGLAVVLDRAGVFQWRASGRCGRSSSAASGWPDSSNPPGQPKQGLLFLTAAVGCCSARQGGVVGGIRPIAVIALGLIVALNGGTRRRWRTPGATTAVPRAGRRIHRIRTRHRPAHHRTLVTPGGHRYLDRHCGGPACPGSGGHQSSISDGDRVRPWFGDGPLGAHQPCHGLSRRRRHQRDGPSRARSDAGDTGARAKRP